ncbi:hypothetical protein [Falsirhodobacter sp. 20TX0035]|uniref:hypothetical protein n=1 Tax=Falsirhodobacter sp. 20TX0035 TaxID=3022019 RepID=UPI00232D9ADF|nr:hypothetical protein [Falsirhodobacter sp. 20TX0035]MDB6452143.1 hypothetical protein [Falsirhodobacter sp. 20TX0035]
MLVMDSALVKNVGGSSSETSVRVLICHRDIDLGLHCLSSLLHFCADPIKIVLHDDGSLTKDDAKRLEDGLPNTVIVSKEEADDVVRPQLARYPRCLAFRERSPTGQKMLDIPLMTTGDIALCDTDILFLRPFHGVFAWPDESADMLFLQDTTDSYSLRPWQTRPHLLRHRYNAGLLMMRKRHYDLAQVETLIGFIEDSEGYKTNEPYQWFLEQTCWSALAGQLDARIWNGKQMRVIDKNDRYDHDLVAGHFVGSVRPLLSRFEASASKTPVKDSPAVLVRSKPAANYTTLNFLQRRVRNKLQRVVGF